MADIISVNPAVVFEGYPELTAWYQYALDNPGIPELRIKWPAVTTLESQVWIDANSGILLPLQTLTASPDDPLEVTVVLYRSSFARLARDFATLDPEVQILMESACGIFWSGQQEHAFVL